MHLKMASGWQWLALHKALYDFVQVKIQFAAVATHVSAVDSWAVEAPLIHSTAFSSWGDG